VLAGGPAETHVVALNSDGNAFIASASKADRQRAGIAAQH
jgi:hypothetical protein